MALSLLLSIFLLWSLLLSTPTTALDITKILDQHPDYSLFNQLLTETHVAKEINRRKSITVLVVPNGAMSGIASQDDETLSITMRTHVVLDYYDSAKIKQVEDDTKLATLYQTSGSADREAGFLKVRKDNNDIKLVSTVSGSSVSARVTKVVTSIPSDLSIVEVSNPIIPPGLVDGSPISPSPSDSSSDSDSSPAPSPRKHHKSPAPTPSDGPASDDGGKDSDSPAPSPHRHGHDHQHKHKHAPASAPAPSDDGSDGASDNADADADDGDTNDADGDGLEDDTASGEDDSSSPRNAVVSGFVIVASLFAML